MNRRFDRSSVSDTSAASTFGVRSRSRTRTVISAIGALAILFAAQLPASAGGSPALATRMVYTHNGREYIVSLAGGSAKRLHIAKLPNPLYGPYKKLHIHPPPLLESYQWSPDGRYLVAQAPGFTLTSDLWLFDASGQKLRNLNACKPQTLRCIVNSFAFPAGVNWASDADKLVYTSPASLSCSRKGCRGGTQAIYSVNLQGRRHKLWPHHALRTDTSVAFVDAETISGLDPAAGLLGAELNGLARSTFWVVTRHDVVYETFKSPDHPWGVRNVADGQHWSLPFLADSITVSRTGVVAGMDRGFVAVRPVRRYGRLHLIARGYAPAWSPDGRWLYYVSRTKLRNFSFRLLEPTLILPPCFIHHRPHCQPPKTFRFKWTWEQTQSAIYRVSVHRVQSNGHNPEKLFSRVSYGFANLNPLAGDNGVIFSSVGTDLALWQHRHVDGHVTAHDIAKHGPIISIDSWTPGTGIQTLVVHGRLPAIQP